MGLSSFFRFTIDPKTLTKATGMQLVRQGAARELDVAGGWFGLSIPFPAYAFHHSLLSMRPGLLPLNLDRPASSPAGIYRMPQRNYVFALPTIPNPRCWVFSPLQQVVCISVSLALYSVSIALYSF